MNVFSVIWLSVIPIEFINNVIAAKIRSCPFREAPDCSMRVGFTYKIIEIPKSSRCTWNVSSFQEILAQILTSNIPVFGSCFIERHQVTSFILRNKNISFWGRSKSEFSMASFKKGTAFSYRFLCSHNRYNFFDDAGKQIARQWSMKIPACWNAIKPGGEITQGLRLWLYKKKIEIFLALQKKWPTVDVSRANCYDQFLFICFAVVSISGLVTCSVISTIVSLFFTEINFIVPILICLHTFALLRVTSSLRWPSAATFRWQRRS